jgi:hypothetical protein
LYALAYNGPCPGFRCEGAWHPRNTLWYRKKPAAQCLCVMRPNLDITQVCALSDRIITNSYRSARARLASGRQGISGATGPQALSLIRSNGDA